MGGSHGSGTLSSTTLDPFMTIEAILIYFYFFFLPVLATDARDDRTSTANLSRQRPESRSLRDIVDLQSGGSYQDRI